ncbi:VWA domain-containing protein [Bacillus sp. AGMB 02131]|uniref:VWA domain-containing protein n=1 Tax=Peribacillus faecalis TaxID=2772559 RepID=A0A927CY35_9BACI|nr:vWA domain-containing protein [Peribacillus faecalis]MBD3108822.1 VWA domain-containing protein [Peribacillus faecalis]
MNNRLTEIILLLDRSGSMNGLEEDTIGGINSLITKQREMEGQTQLTLALFDDQYELVWNGIDAADARLTEDVYYVRGMTALLDAVGKTILDVGDRLASTREEDRPGKVMFVITTDGLENASQEFTRQKVQKMIKHQEEKYNWEFLFMGANIDAAKEAEDIGIKAESACCFEASSEGVQEMFDMLIPEFLNKKKIT